MVFGPALCGTMEDPLSAMIEIHPIPPDYEGRHYVAVRGVGEMARGETVPRITG